MEPTSIDTVADAIQFLMRTGLTVLSMPSGVYRVVDLNDINGDPYDEAFDAEGLIEQARYEREVVIKEGIPLRVRAGHVKGGARQP